MKTTKYFFGPLVFAASLTMANLNNLYAVVAEKQCRLGTVQCTANCCAPSISQCASQCGTGGGSSSGGIGDFELTTCDKGQYLRLATSLTETASCRSCPTPGTTAGDGLSVPITGCYIPANDTQTDETGTYVYIQDCNYTE